MRPLEAAQRRILRLVCRLFDFGIGDARVINGLQTVNQRALGICDVAERDGTLLEMPLGELGIDNAIDELRDAFLGVFFQTAGSGLHRVAHHHNGLLSRLRIRTGIAEGFFVNGLAHVFVAILYVEILDEPRSVVRAYKFLDDLRQMVFLSQSQSVGHMIDDDLRTAFFGDGVVRIHARLVLGEKRWIQHLADVMIERPCSGQLGLGTDFVGHLCGEVRNLHGVVERSLCHFTHLTEYRVVGVRELDQRNTGGEAEELFNEIHQRIGKEQEDAADDHIHDAGAVESIAVQALREVVADADDEPNDHHRQDGAQQLRALGQFPKRIDDRGSRHDLPQHELKRTVEREGGEQRTSHNGHERGAGIHEDAHKDGNEGVGDEVNAIEMVGHHEIGDDGEHRDEREQQEHAVGRGEIIATEKLEISEQQTDEQYYEYHLSCKDKPIAARGVHALFAFFLERIEDAHVLSIDNLPPVDDELSALHHADIVGHLRKLTLQFQAIFGGIVFHVDRQIVVEIASAQRLLRQGTLVAVQEIVVGRSDGKEVLHFSGRGLLSSDEPQRMRVAFQKAFIVRHIQYAAGIYLPHVFNQPREIIDGDATELPGIEILAQSGNLLFGHKGIYAIIGHELPHDTVTSSSVL